MFGRKTRDYLEMAVSAAVVSSGVYSLARMSYAARCVSDEACDRAKTTAVLAVYPQVVATGCIASRITCAYNDSFTDRTRAYEEDADRYGRRHPDADRDHRLRRRAVAAVAAAYVAATVPVNALRVASLHRAHRSAALTAYYVLLYAQNLVVCVPEMRFVGQCARLLVRFRSINDDIAASAAAPRDRSGRRNVSAAADAIETLRLRHRHVAAAVRRLNDLYGFQLGLSLCVLFFMTLIDVYEFLSGARSAAAAESAFYYAWLCQYSFRFCAIVTAAHVTTKEAEKSKKIVTDINSKSLDNSTKEELQLFLNEMSSRSVDFTTFDMFNINVNLITSAIVTGTTYLIVLFQLS